MFVCVCVTNICHLSHTQCWQVVSVERLQDFKNQQEASPPTILVEPPRYLDALPSHQWPSEGLIQVKDLTVRWRAELPPAVRNLNFTIKGGERIGVVGRTGAGKSSLMPALFRIADEVCSSTESFSFDSFCLFCVLVSFAVHDLMSPVLRSLPFLLRDSGCCIGLFLRFSLTVWLSVLQVTGLVTIDGLDTSTLGIHELRSKLALIPQDSLLFSGTLKSNIDPLDSLRTMNAQKKESAEQIFSTVASPFSSAAARHIDLSRQQLERSGEGPNLMNLLKISHWSDERWANMWLEKDQSGNSVVLETVSMDVFSEAVVTLWCDDQFG